MRFTLSVLVFASLSLTMACKKKGGDAPCPNKYRDVPADKQNGDFSCSCAPGASGTVWGSAIYTTDSSICGAAVHAGALAANASGSVTVRKAAGCGSYTGTAANGVTTQDWGSFDSSFYFSGKGDGKCPPPKAAAAAPPPTPPAAGGECPATFDDVPTGTDQLECKCSTVPTSGTIWGVGIYTSDSSICRAAVHAGAIPAAGGSVKVKRAAGCAKYNGSDANGIKTESWGSHGGSFYFDGKGDGKCA